MIQLFGTPDKKQKNQKTFSQQNKKHYKEISKFTIPTEKLIDPKYKTELCKKFSETGKCPYGPKCRFAHGKEELNFKINNSNYKKKPCKTFSELGFCPYGSRCSFKHDERKLKEMKFFYHFVNLFIYDKVEKFNKRLPIFEEISKLAEQQNNEKLIQSSSPIISMSKSNEILRDSSISTISNEEESMKEIHDEYFEECPAINLCL